MSVPFDVVLVGAGGSEHIGNKCSDLVFGSTDPGGFASVTVTLAEPVEYDAVIEFAEVAVYDGQTHEQVGGGRLIQPQKSVGDDGQVWALTAIGEGPAHMLDRTLPVMWIDTQLENFYPRQRFRVAARLEIGATPEPGASTSDSALIVGLPGGSVIGNNFVGAFYHDLLVQCGQQLGGYGFTRYGGLASSDYQTQSAVYGDDGSPSTAVISSANFSTSSVTAGPFVVTTDFTAGADVLRLGADKSAGGATTIANDTTWTSFYNVYVAARRFLKDGTNAANSAHANAYVLASEVVADMLGRGWLPRFDGANATIDTSTHQFDQLVYLDGVTPHQVLEDLLSIESGYTWQVWEKQLNDLYRFEFVARSTEVRYEATAADGFESPAPQTDLYNEVKVRYANKAGKIRWATATQTVPSLTALGITRTAVLDLSNEAGSAASAAQAAADFLAAHATPPNAGTLKVARPIFDLEAGRYVKPWEVRAGGLIRIKDSEARMETLTADGPDGITVFRIVSASYSTSEGAATLELDEYAHSDSREIARLATKRRRRK